MLSGRARGILVGSVFLLVVAALLNITELFVMAGALVCLVALAFVVTLRSAGQFRVRQSAPELVTVGQPFDIELYLQSSGMLDEIRMDVSLDVPEGLEIERVEPMEAAEPGSGWRCTLTASRRGRRHLGMLHVKVQDPALLTSVSVRADAPVDVLAAPSPYGAPLPSPTRMQSRFSGAGQAGRRAQDGAISYGVRPWAPGDAVRRVHWPSTARLGELAVLEFEPDTSRELVVLLDTRRLPDDGAWAEAFEQACSVARTLISSHGSLDHLSARLVVDGQVLDCSGGPVSLGASPDALRALALAKPQSDAPLEDSLAALLPGMQPGSGVAVVTCLWDEGLRLAVEHARKVSSNVEVYFVAGGQNEVEVILDP